MKSKTIMLFQFKSLKKSNKSKSKQYNRTYEYNK